MKCCNKEVLIIIGTYIHLLEKEFKNLSKGTSVIIGIENLTVHLMVLMRSLLFFTEITECQN